MYVTAINGQGGRKDAVYLEQMYRLRARVFSGRLGWDVNVDEGREFDSFDELDPTYIMCILDDGTVAGSVRVLPALGPTMLEKVFPQLIGPGRYQPHRNMVESSRFCVDTTLQATSSRQAVHDVTANLFAGCVEWGLNNGVEDCVTVTDLRFERILALTRWPLRRIGEPVKIGVTTAIAGMLDIDVESFSKLKPKGYRSHFPLARRDAA